MLTAQVRARMLPVLLACHRPMMIATDGLFCASTAPVKGVRASSKLGGWKVNHYDRMFTARVGVYRGERATGDVLKASGFFVDEIDYGQLEDLWRAEGIDGVMHWTSNRFVGLGVALQRDPQTWRRWLDERQRIIFQPQQKTAQPEPGGYVLWPEAAAPGPSEPYDRKQRLLDSLDLSNEQGMDQPLTARI
jgi:hypothetical protein